LRSGIYRHRITIQERAVTTGSSSGIIESWSDFETVWAAIDPIRGDD
jgi:SPP1 family predicted phage head-tail adaptor